MEHCECAVVAAIDSLQIIERFLAAKFPEDNPRGPHSQCVAEKLAHAYGAFAFDIVGASEQTHHVLLAQLQLKRVLDGNNTLVRRELMRENVKRGRFSSARRAGEHDVQTRFDGSAKKGGHGLIDRPELY